MEVTMSSMGEKVDSLEVKVDDMSELLQGIVVPTLKAHGGRLKRLEKLAPA